MKASATLLVSALCLAVCTPRVRADQLDDIIAGMRSGAAAPANVKEVMKAAGAAAGKNYTDSIVDLYILEIKFSIVDNEDDGGWPCRSFLVEDDPNLRADLAKALKARFEAKPDAILAYALVCPALYADDAALVDRVQQYLKDSDPFLYKLEETQVDHYWRPYVAAVKKLVLTPQLLSKMLPYIASNGVDRELAAIFANPLGLSPSGSTWAYRGIGIQEPDPQHVYGFGIGRGANPDLLLSQRRPDGIHVFRASREGQIITALIFNPSNKQVTMVTPADAQAEFNSTWNFWANDIDDLVAGSGLK